MTAPYDRVSDEPFYPLPDRSVSYEDACVWIEDGRFHVIFNDMTGAITGEDPGRPAHSLVRRHGQRAGRLRECHAHVEHGRAPANGNGITALRDFVWVICVGCEQVRVVASQGQACTVLVARGHDCG